jgi:hypothetical protein
VPIQTRCPSCAAAVPSTAAWCSLCHADLRPRTEARSSARTVVPTSGPAAGGGRAARRQAAEGGTQVLDPPEVEDVPRGRHSRVAEPDLVPVATGGRAAARRAAESQRRGRTASSGRRERTSSVGLDGLVLPSGDAATADEVGLVADQMLTRLAIAEQGRRLPNPANLPGGKWGLAAMGTLGVIALLLVVYTILGLVFGR